MLMSIAVLRFAILVLSRALGAVIGYIIAIARNITANKQNRVAGEQNKINEQGQG